MLLLLIRTVCLANKLDGKFLKGRRLVLLHLRVGVTAYIQQVPRRVCGHHKSVSVHCRVCMRTVRPYTPEQAYSEKEEKKKTLVALPCVCFVKFNCGPRCLMKDLLCG